MPASFDSLQGVRPPPNAPRKQSNLAYNANSGVRIPSMNTHDISAPSFSGSSFRPDTGSFNDPAASFFGGESSGPSILEGDRSINGPPGVLDGGAAPSWLSRRMLPPSDFDHPMTAYADTPTGRSTSGSSTSLHRDGHTAAVTSAGAFQTPSMARPPTSSLYEQLARGMAASRKQNSNIRTSLASSSGWGSPRTIAPSTSRLGTDRLFSGESSGFAAGPSRSGSRMPGESNIFNTPNHLRPNHLLNPSTNQQPPTRLPRFSFPQNTIATPNVMTRGINQDGSYNVVRDEEDANNSGLLALSPAVRGPGAALGMTAIFPRISKVSNTSSSATSASAERSKATSNPSDQQSNATMIEHALEIESYEGEDEEANRRQSHFLQTGLRGQGLRGDGIEAGQNTSDLLEIMRNWREDAMKHHLYDTAIFWGDKILSLETEQIAWNDAYNLATAYFLTHRYAQAEHLLCTPLRLAKGEGSNQDGEENGAGVEETEDDEGHPLGVDNDELGAAIAATHRNSKLPPAMLAKAYASKPRFNGHSSSDSNDGFSDPMGEEATHILDRKRKDRTFTISGTGTASEGGTSVAGSVAGDINGESDRIIENQNDGEKEQSDEKVTEAKIAEAWREEQKLAMEEVRQTDPAPPDGISLVSVSIPCRYLAAQCMARQGKYQEALDELSGWKGDRNDLLEQSYKQPSRDGLIKLSSSIWHLKGLIQLHLRNIEEARESFMRSLSLDIKNYESFDHLVRGHLLTASQQWAFIENLEYVAQAGGDAAQLEALNVVRLLYTILLDKNGKAHAQQAAASRRQLIGLYGLGNSPDVLLGLAEEMFSRMRYDDAYTVTQKIMELSKDHETALPVHISSMYMSERLRPALYLLAHHLTDTDPDMAAGWYAVGCWYFSTQRWLEARKYFSKSVQLDPRFAPGWIAFAHTFALEGESDQAIISYSTAERNFSAHYLIKLFLGMEHLSQGNLTLAELYLTGSAEVWEEDALSRNERGVVAYYGGKMEEAISLFRSALEAAKDVQQPAKEWLTTHLNLAFALRRTGQLNGARQSFLKVLELDPDIAVAYTGVGMCLHGEGDLEEAISWYHRALAIDPTDKYANDLLSFALQESAQQLPLQLMAAADQFVIQAEQERLLVEQDREGYMIVNDDRNQRKDAFGIKIESGDQTALIQNQSSTMDEGTREMSLAEGSMSAEMDESY